MNQFLIRMNDGLPLIHIMYRIKDIRWIEIDIGRNRSNGNYWFDIVIAGIGFNYDTAYNHTDKLRFINDWKIKQ